MKEGQSKVPPIISYRKGTHHKRPSHTYEIELIEKPRGLIRGCRVDISWQITQHGTNVPPHLRDRQRECATPPCALSPSLSPEFLALKFNLTSPTNLLLWEIKHTPHPTPTKIKLKISWHTPHQDSYVPSHLIKCKWPYYTSYYLVWIVYGVGLDWWMWNDFLLEFYEHFVCDFKVAI